MKHVGNTQTCGVLGGRLQWAGRWTEGLAHNKANTQTPATEIIVSQVLAADLGLNHEWPSPRAPQRAPSHSESVRGVDSETEKMQLKLLLLLSYLKCQMIPVISPTPFTATCVIVLFTPLLS